MDAPKMKPMEALRAVVEEGGRDYLYVKENGSDCKYAKGAGPSCLVGHALHKMGAPIELLQSMDKCASSTSFSEVMAMSSAYLDNDPDGIVENDFTDRMDAEQVQWLVDSFSAAELEAFAKAQDLQDRGHTWGAALMNAEILYARSQRNLSTNLQ